MMSCRLPGVSCSAAQVAVAWLVDQEGVIVIPEAARPESHKSSIDALGIRLNDKHRAAIAALSKDRRFVRPPFAPEWDALHEIFGASDPASVWSPHAGTAIVLNDLVETIGAGRMVCHCRAESNKP